MRHIQVYRFTDDEFTIYRQVVVFGKRREKRSPDPVPEGNRLKRLSLSELPPLDLDMEDGKVIEIPSTENEVRTFLLNILTEQEVAQTLAASPVWGIVAKYKPSPRAIIKAPAMPLKRAHIGVAIAAGAVGGCMGDHILVGTTKRDKSVEELPTESGGAKIVERYESKSIVRIFDRNGIHVLQ